MLLQVLLSSALKVGTCSTFERRHCLASPLHYNGQGRNNIRPYGVGMEVWLVKPFLLVCTQRTFLSALHQEGSLQVSCPLFSVYLKCLLNHCMWLQSGLQQCLLLGRVENIILQWVSINFPGMYLENCQWPPETIQRKNHSLGQKVKRRRMLRDFCTSDSLRHRKRRDMLIYFLLHI